MLNEPAMTVEKTPTRNFLINGVFLVTFLNLLKLPFLKS